MNSIMRYSKENYILNNSIDGRGEMPRPFLMKGRDKMIITTAKEIKETIRDGMFVYRRNTYPTRVIDAKTTKGQVRIKLMHNNGTTEWVNHYPGDTYTQF